MTARLVVDDAAAFRSRWRTTDPRLKPGETLVTVLTADASQLADLVFVTGRQRERAHVSNALEYLGRLDPPGSPHRRLFAFCGVDLGDRSGVYPLGPRQAIRPCARCERLTTYGRHRAGDLQAAFALIAADPESEAT